MTSTQKRHSMYLNPTSVITVMVDILLDDCDEFIHKYELVDAQTLVLYGSFATTITLNAPSSHDSESWLEISNFEGIVGSTLLRIEEGAEVYLPASGRRTYDVNINQHIITDQGIFTIVLRNSFDKYYSPCPMNVHYSDNFD